MADATMGEISREPALASGGLDRPATGRFHGDRNTVFWMQVRFILLTFLTLGIYRFWAKTKTRRYFWSNAEIAGDRLEYLGTAKELLIGFLIALAVLIPVYWVLATAQTLATASPNQAALLSLVGTIVLLLFIQVALYRLWRYRLTRTAWRGIRFGMDGSTAKFVVLSALYFLLAALTLGLAVPWMRVALARYRINNARFGDRYFQCDATGGMLFLPWLVVYLTLGTGYVWYLVREFNTVVSRTRFGDSTISVGMRALPIYGWLLLTLAMFFGASFLVFLISTGVTSGVLKSAGEQPELASAAFFGTWIVGGVLLVLGFAVMVVAFVLFEVAKQACNSLEIEDIGAFEAAAQSAGEQPAHGEGLADALDVGAI